MTDSYKKIFVSLDGTEMQSEVFARACEITAASGAELYVGHVIDSTPMQAAGTYPATLIPSLEKAWKDSIEADVESARKLGTIKSITVEAKAGPRSRDPYGRFRERDQAPTWSSAAPAAFRTSSTRFSAPSPRSSCAAVSAMS